MIYCLQFRRLTIITCLLQAVKVCRICDTRTVVYSLRNSEYLENIKDIAYLTVILV